MSPVETEKIERLLQPETRIREVLPKGLQDRLGQRMDWLDVTYFSKQGVQGEVGSNAFGERTVTYKIADRFLVVTYDTAGKPRCLYGGITGEESNPLQSVALTPEGGANWKATATGRVNAGEPNQENPDARYLDAQDVKIMGNNYIETEMVFDATGTLDVPLFFQVHSAPFAASRKPWGNGDPAERVEWRTSTYTEELVKTSDGKTFTVVTHNNILDQGSMDELSKSKTGDSYRYMRVHDASELTTK